MNEAILEILADAFECSAREAESVREAQPTKSADEAFHDGRAEAYRDVVSRMRRIVAVGTNVHRADGV